MAKKILKTFLKYYLKIMAKLALAIHRPFVIAVAGSTNKSFIKDEINRHLRQSGLAVRSNIKSYNTEIGLPLAILSLPSGYNSYRRWLAAIFGAPRAVFSRAWPKFLVLELGVARPGDMKYLLTIIKPQITVITNLTQRYLESFSDMNELAAEYFYLAQKTAKLIILNLDNPRLAQISRKIKTPRQTYSLKNPNADWLATVGRQNNLEQKIKIKHQGQEQEITIKRPGEHHIYAALAALAVKNFLKKQKLA